MLSVVLKQPLPHGLDKGHRQARVQWCLGDALFEDSVFYCSHAALFLFLCLTAATQKLTMYSLYPYRSTRFLKDAIFFFFFNVYGTLDSHSWDA